MTAVWTINFDEIVEVLNSGIRRADVFMGIGLNAADQAPPISHVLSQQGSVIQLVKDELTSEEKANAAHEFAKWVRSNGFRELLETFSIFLLRLYDVIHNVHVAYGDGTKIMPIVRFERLGISDQIDQLQKFIPILDERVQILQSLNKARNCYAHRRGIVGANDTDEATGAFNLQWLRLIYEVEEPDGTIIPEEKMFGHFLAEGGVVRIKVEVADQSFSVGQELVIERASLKQICLCIYTIGHGLAEETMKFALASGAKAVAAVAPAETPEALAVSQDDPQ